jgi:hypothetical protein
MDSIMVGDKIRKLDAVWNSCGRKNRYGSQEEADKIAGNRSKAAGHEIHGYFCTYCAGYHIGRKEP